MMDGSPEPPVSLFIPSEPEKKVAAIQLMLNPFQPSLSLSSSQTHKTETNNPLLCQRSKHCALNYKYVVTLTFALFVSSAATSLRHLRLLREDCLPPTVQYIISYVSFLVIMHFICYPTGVELLSTFMQQSSVCLFFTLMCQKRHQWNMSSLQNSCPVVVAVLDIVSRLPVEINLILFI